jgi:hypothetical protein
MFKALADMFKSIPSDKLDGIKDVEDLWNGPGHSNEHSLPSREEMGPFGPAESMSGRGASKMVREYSSPAPQSSMVDLYARMENYMGHMGKSVSALASTVSDVLKNQKATSELLDSFVKAEADREAAAQKAEPVFGDDTYIGNALKRFEKARTAFRKSDFADEGDRELRRGLLDEAVAALKSAKALLTKAEDAVEDRTGATIDKAMDDIKQLSARVAKAQAEIAKADKDEEDKKEKEAEDAKKAEDPPAEAAEVTEKAEDTAKAEEPSHDQMQQAIKAMQDAAEGNSVLQTSLKEFMDLFSKASRGSFMPPTFQMLKGGTAESADVIETRVQAAKDGNVLATPADCVLADSLLNRRRAMEKGMYPKEKYEEDIIRAPEVLRDIFQGRVAA